MERLNETNTPLRPRPANSVVPLTAIQRHLWNGLVDQISGLREGDASMRISGPLNIALLQMSLETVIRRHESLRTRIIEINGIPRQQIDAPCTYDLEVIDVPPLPALEVDRKVIRLGEEFLDEKIDLSVGPLFIAKLLRLSEREHVLMLGIDHIVADGTSCGILRKEIFTTYKQVEQGLPISLPYVPVQFADYAVWQQQTYCAWRSRNEPYWRKRLAGVPIMKLPTVNDPSEAKDLSLTMIKLSLGNPVSAALRNIAWRERTLLPLVVLTIIVAAIAHWCSQRDFVVAFVSHGRHSRPELANTIGFLATFLHLRIQIAESDRFLDLLKQITVEFDAAQQHLAFDRMRDLIPNFTSSIYFNWMPTNRARRSVLPAEKSPDRANMQWYPIRKSRRPTLAPSDKLGFDVWPEDDGIDGIALRLQYHADMYASNTIERLNQSLRMFAEEFAKSPLTSVGSLHFIA